MTFTGQAHETTGIPKLDRYLKGKSLGFHQRAYARGIWYSLSIPGHEALTAARCYLTDRGAAAIKAKVERLSGMAN